MNSCRRRHGRLLPLISLFPESGNAFDHGPSWWREHIQGESSQERTQNVSHETIPLFSGEIMNIRCGYETLPAFILTFSSSHIIHRMILPETTKTVVDHLCDIHLMTTIMLFVFHFFYYLVRTPKDESKARYHMVCSRWNMATIMVFSSIGVVLSITYKAAFPPHNTSAWSLIFLVLHALVSWYFLREMKIAWNEITTLRKS